MTGGKFRRLPTAAWNAPEFARLPPARADARYLLRYLELGPHTCSVPGLFAAGVAGIAEALGWQTDETLQLFELLERAGLLLFDRDARVIFLPGSFDHEPPANVKSIKGWEKIVRELPDCPVKQKACAALLERLRGMDSERGEPTLDGSFADAARFLVTVPDTVSCGYGIPQKHGSTEVLKHGDQAVAERPPPPPATVVLSKKKNVSQESQECRKAVATRFEQEFRSRSRNGREFAWSATDRDGVARLCSACKDDQQEAIGLLQEFIRRMDSGEKFYEKNFRPSYIANQVNTLRMPLASSGATTRNGAERLRVNPALKNETPGRKFLGPRS